MPDPRMYVSIPQPGKACCILDGMPLCPEGTEERARATYAQAREQSRFWANGELHFRHPEEPPIWNGEQFI
jgi:hypothetical protein